MEPKLHDDDTSEPETKSFARYLTHTARILMGLAFFVFGLNGFLNFMPQPETPMPEGAVAFSEALMKTGYMFPLIAGTQLIVGLLLLINRFVPLALALIAPVLVNIVAFHVFLEPSPAGLVPGLVLSALEIYLALAYRDSFRPMLAMRTGASRKSPSTISTFVIATPVCTL